MTDKQLLDALQNVDGKYTEEVEQYLSTRKIRPRAAKLFLPAAAAAACLGAVLFAAVPRNHDQVNVADSDITPQLMQDQSAAKTEPPVTDMPAAVSENTQTAVQTAEPAVAAVSALTKAPVTTFRTAEETKPQPVSKAKPNVPAAAEKPAEADTEAAVPEPPAETTVTEALPETTAPEPPAPVYEMGDVDMDGKITYSDLLSALIIDNFSNRRHQELSPFTESQAFLADVNSNGCVDSDDTAIIGQYLRLTQYLQLEVSLSEVAAQSEEIVETIDRLIKESENEENPKNLNLGKQITDAYIKISAYVGKTVYDENCRNGIPAEFWSAEEPLTWEQLSTIIEDAKTWRWVPVE